jgi:2-oxo-4-hydroxy-4-carboxy-5-ureidoimidazoline decarboxylase
VAAAGRPAPPAHTPATAAAPSADRVRTTAAECFNKVLTPLVPWVLAVPSPDRSSVSEAPMTAPVPPPPAAPGLTWLDSAEDRAARAALRQVCSAGAWLDALLAHRPYEDVPALLAASDTATAQLNDRALAEAMAAHPAIGRPDAGDAASAREQRGMADASQQLKAEMRELNLAYQERFGHVFLICASDLSARQMRDAARQRLANSPERERETVRGELLKINRIRLTRLAEREPERA